jgi:peptidoglycan/xylan/chitin deacetylase (PgdA/CDA1 family)
MILRITAVVTLVSLLTALVAVGVISAFSIFRASRLLIFFCVMLSVDALLLYGIFDWKAPIFGRIFWKGPKDLHAISLTFDDGPNQPYTSQILDILKASNIKATFFVIGENAQTFPDAVKREIAEGHEIGNHTYNHGVLPLKDPRYITDQIDKTNDLVEKIAGVKPVLFRAPHGWRNPWVNRCAAQAGCLPVAWTLGVWDTDRPGADVIARRALRGLCDGCVLLLHDGCGTEHGADASQLVAALPAIIRGVQRSGYKFLKLSDMAKETEKK